MNDNVELHCFSKYCGLLSPEILDIILTFKEKIEKDEKREQQFTKYTLNYLIP